MPDEPFLDGLRAGRYFDWQGQPITLQQWMRLFDDERHLGDDHVGDVHVSTVWLGLDHGYGDGPPLIFETMIFGGPLDQECWLYATEQQARAGHARAVAIVADSARESPHP
jgi:hypothetical protein